MNRSESIKELATALAKAQGEMGKAIKDANNPFFKSNYADLESCIDASRSALVKNGLSVAQFVTSTNDGLGINTILMHSSGEFIESTCRVLTVKKDPQGEGSALTYYRRYLYASAIGLVTSDDDGEAAMSRDVQKEPIRVSVTKDPVLMKDPGQYKMTFMKAHIGKSVADLHNTKELAGIIKWLSNQEKLSGDGINFLANAKAYLNALDEVPF
jgi:ERF superfamily.